MPERPADDDKALKASGDTQNSFEAIAKAILDNPRQAIGESTKESAATALRFFRETHGTPTPAKITRSMVSSWLDLLAERPARLPHKHRDMPLRDVVALYKDQEVARLSPKTYNGHAAALAALWKKATKAGQIREDRRNPFADQRVSVVAARPERSRGFGKDELTAIFSLPIFTESERPKGGKGHASYWMPLLLLWTGARPEEVAQLLVSDFRQDENGSWLLTFTDSGIHPHKGKRFLKTTRHASGRRTIPVPQPLLDLGMVPYLEYLGASGEVALFPLLRTKGKRGLLATAWAEWWGKMVYDKGILSKGDIKRQPVREFRHSWTTAARQSGIPREAREYIQGHKPPNATANEEYGELDSLGRQIERLKFDGLDLSGVKPWKG